ncbi:uncharacterized protein LOC100900313 [Galendromus occidentalis]|uniref:Uncharacterized protein LOC100900313 n=1 Tax=Galendromus occidentalis TaxID=34638 RepID=A0AAJ7SGS0_9ACAR|nr:uncharacterized protein LOC100900313 [Galendromus occidentalis]
MEQHWADWSDAGLWQWAPDEEDDELVYFRCSSSGRCADLLPAPPEFVPPPPAPPGVCAAGLISDDLQFCPASQLMGDRALSSLLGPSALPVFTICCAILLTLTMVGIFLFCKHKKKVEHFLPCKSNQVPGAPGQSQISAPGINPLLLNSNHTATLHPFLQGDGLNPIELSDVKCGSYGQQGITTLPSAFRGIVTPSVISLNDPQRSQRRKPAGANKEQYNPIYEQVLDQDRQDDEHGSDLESGRKQSCSSDSMELNSNMQYGHGLEPKQSYYQSKTPLAFPPNGQGRGIPGQQPSQQQQQQANTLTRRTLLHPYQSTGPVTENIYAVIDDEVHQSPRLPYTMDRLNGCQRRMPVVSVQQPQRQYATGGRLPVGVNGGPRQMLPSQRQQAQYPSVYSEPQDMSPYSNT